MKFEDLGIIPPILEALKEKNYTTPTPIQQKAIPEVLKGLDLLATAQTGTGKTAAFAIPIIQSLYNTPGVLKGPAKIQALIVTPTRELAIQIDDNIKEYSKHCPIKHTVIFGGVKQAAQVERLRKGVHILTATPGRLLDLINQRYLDIKNIKIFVLDEADRMLDMGFIHDIKKILQIIPKQRQSLFFSATMPDNIVKLSNQILSSPKEVSVNPVSSTAETIVQHLYYTNRDLKKDLLVYLLNEKNIQQVLVFSKTKHGADRIVRDLQKKKINAAAIHGNKNQNQRQKVLTDFKNEKLRVLVATDIAARGIDIQQLEYVVNYDIPDVPETYVHRIGRSGRAGENGIALSFCEAEENDSIKQVEKLIGLKINVVKNHPFPQTDKPMNESERKAWQKEKDKRKQAFFAARKKNKSSGGRRY